MGYILLKAENCPFSERDWLVNDSSEDLGIIEGSSCWLRGIRLLFFVVARLSRLVYLGSFEDSCLNCVWFEVDVKVPLLHLF